MSSVWEATHDGHTIRVENRIFGEKLWVDGQLQDAHSGLSLKPTLRATIPRSDGSGDTVEAVLFGWFTVGCRVRVNGIEMPTRRVPSGRTSN